jgi:hypothetical protein
MLGSAQHSGNSSLLAFTSDHFSAKSAEKFF